MLFIISMSHLVPLLEFNHVARMDALDCLKADYAALKADPKHQLHDYFHVINYSMWSHQVIGEATVNRSDYPSAEAVDEEIARTLAEWQKESYGGFAQVKSEF